MNYPPAAAASEYFTEKTAARRAVRPARIEEIRILAAHSRSLEAPIRFPVLYADPACVPVVANDTRAAATIGTPGAKAKVDRNSDLVYTDPAFAARIVNYFRPSGFCMDPCRGRGAFYDALPDDKDWCEIDQGRDFLDYVPAKPIDWIVTNPPWSAKSYRPVLRKSCQLADNVVMLTRLDRALAVSQGRHDDFLRYKEIVFCGFNGAMFLDVEGCPVKSGFPLGIIHWQRGWGHDLLSKEGDGGTKWTYWR